MKNNVSLILNIVLLLAVGFLYFQVFGNKKTGAATEAENDDKRLTVAYINADSILLNYEVFRKQSEVLAQKEKDADADLQTKGGQFEREMQQVQQKMQQGLLAPNQVQQEQQRLARRQQQLMQERDQVAQSLMQESQALNQMLQDNLMAELEKVKVAEGYDMILSYSEGGQILLIDDSLDITSRVLKALNALPDSASKPDGE